MVSWSNHETGVTLRHAQGDTIRQFAVLSGFGNNFSYEDRGIMFERIEIISKRAFSSRAGTRMSENTLSPVIEIHFMHNMD
jgi:hypothetical protein